MYDGAVTNVRTNGDITCEFPITISLHQGSALSPYLFALVKDELTKSIQAVVPWGIPFTEVLVDEVIHGVNVKLEIWRDALEFEGC